MRVINDPHFFMKIFLDTAETDLIRKYYGTGLIDGITTNPTLIRKSGRDPEEVYQEIQDIGIRDISMEVVGDSNEMIEESFQTLQQSKFLAHLMVYLPVQNYLVKI